MTRILTLIVCFAAFNLTAQTAKYYNWKDAGFRGTKPVYTQTVNILSVGGNNTNSAPNNAAFASAVSALNNKGGVIYFPKGVYNFTTTISINRDSIILKGDGYDSTQLRFSMSGTLNNCINISGTQMNADTSSFSVPGFRDSSSVMVLNASSFQSGDWVYLQTTDNAYMTSTWAYNSLGQIMKVKSINGNKITFDSPFRFYYSLNLQPRIKKITARKAIGFECFKIQRLDATTNQTSLFSFDKAVQCWIHGVEGDSTNYAHVELNRSSNIDITNCWFHHAFAYGGSGQAYGIAFQYSSNEIKAENNIFEHLRHSLLFQAGSNGNVCGYNYSFDPFWNQFPLPANSAGDIVFHGNYPFANLCEGNIHQHAVFDDSHGKNGPHNTLFRNRSELYGIYLTNSPSPDSTQILGCEVTNTSTGQYVISGNGNVLYANNVHGTITPAGTGNFQTTSGYYTGSQRPACFNPGTNNWPVVGVPNGYNTGSNAAKDRFSQGVMAACVCTATFTLGENELAKNTQEVLIYPNPSGNQLAIKSNHPVKKIAIYNAEGKCVFISKGDDLNIIDISSLNSGLYFVETDRRGVKERIKIVKE